MLALDVSWSEMYYHWAYLSGYMQFGPKFLRWIGQFTGFKDNFYVFVIEGDVTLSRLCAH